MITQYRIFQRTSLNGHKDTLSALNMVVFNKSGFTSFLQNSDDDIWLIKFQHVSSHSGTCPRTRRPSMMTVQLL